MNQPPQATSKPAVGCLLCSLRIAVCALFVARGYLYLNGLAPLSVLFWNEAWMEVPLKTFFGMDWESYTAHSEGLILSIQRSVGLLFLAAAVACWRVRGHARPYANGVVLAGVLFLLLHGLLRWVDANFQIAMLLEYFLQWGTPLLLLLYGRLRGLAWFVLAWLMVACTFAGHGCYALGWGVPLNNDFVNMSMRLLRVDADTAVAFLKTVGVLDFVVPIALWVPKLRVPAAIYASAWGLLTAAARIVSHWTPAEDYYGMHPWIAEAVVRLPHGLVPMALVFYFILQDSRLRTAPSQSSV